MLLQGRVAVVTGGGRGIGRAIAEAFYQEGARVAIASRDSRTLQTAATEINRGDHRIVPLRCDVTRRAEVEVMIGNVVELWDRVDILGNNAGVNARTPVPAAADGPDAPAGDVDARWRAIVDTNLTGAFACVCEAVPRMPDDGRGRIINVASVLAKIGVAGYAAYCASKHGMVGLTKALALELAPRRIAVNALCPGWVDTGMARDSLAALAAEGGVPVEEYRRRREATVPLGRFIGADEVARLAVFLASDAGAGMTGQAINLDGGVAMW
jgi:NAD(P)-dependent dehydrogenase (short-subunit alcohol dehydrogenase family)